ncbi:Formin-like protein [Pseudolycoriella hygida]|uniref:Formin-like protein n=1 Tax=Pseudolycoriella hygida TaxID=35572 RepID=A0A9Q0NDY8_9DIPT|nr:Formin-like protein [Pseudolycoriella hygida]
MKSAMTEPNNKTVFESQPSYKRNRSGANTSMNDNPTKKLRTMLGSKSTLAEIVKNDVEGHIIDITSGDDSPELTKDQGDILIEKLDAAFFMEEDISMLHFNDPPNFEAARLRLNCSNDATKVWVENASMDLPPDKAKLLKNYDDEKKWDIICDQRDAFHNKCGSYVAGCASSPRHRSNQ